MKKIYLLVLFVFGFSAFAQQKGISYQAVIINPNAVAAPGYNGSSIPLANKSICLSFQIMNSANQVEFQESQSITTDAYGMVNVVIGSGTSGSGLVANLDAVNWNQGSKKLVVGVNTDGVCSNYTEISNQVLNYTPYSFYAQNADIKDGYVTTVKLADGAVTDPKVAMGINPAKVGLGNVNNTSDANKPVSTATQTALNLKANIASPTFTGTVSGIDKAMVGLSNVDNTTDANKPISIATQTALNLKANTTDVTTSLALKADISSLSPVATSGNYNDLTNKPSIPSSFALPTATASVLGGVKVGANLSIDANGVLNATGGNNVSSLTGVLPIANGGTGTTSIAGIKSVLGFNSSKVAIGDQAGQTNQADGSVGVGGGAGANNQGGSAVAIGYVAGNNNQGASSVAIGPNAAQSGQGNSAVAIGFAAGQNGQGANSVAIGSFAGISQVANSIAINATGISTPLNPTNAGFYVAPVRNASESNSLFYNTTTKEITYGTAAPTGPLNLATGGTGILPIANGGTGATTLTGLVKGNGTSALTAAVSGTDYQEPITLTTTGSGAATLTGNTLNIPSTTNYTLPTSSASVLGGVKVGTNLSIDGSGILSTTSSPTFTGSVTAPIYASTPQALTAGTTINWNPINGLNASVTLDQNSTLSFTTIPTAGSYGTLVVTQDATGGRTLTLPSTTNKVLGSTSTTTVALSSAANAKDILNFYYDGTNCYWNIGQGYGTAASAAITNLATSVSGTLPVANGGTGAATLTGLVKGNGTGAMTAATAGTDYLAPTGSAANLTNFPTLNQNTTGNAATATTATSATNVTGTVAVANGGTGATSLTANNVLLGNGTSALQAVAPGTSGNVLTSNGTTWTSTAPAASGVPYTGATGPVNLGAYNLTVSSFTIGQGKTPASGDNLAIGRSALNNTTSNGWPNIGLGSFSLNQTTDGKNNVGVGLNALYVNTTGSNNIGIGTEAARNASTSSNITAIGMEALKYESGAGNTALGSYAGKPSTSAVYSGTTNSTFLGYNTTTGKTTDTTITNSTAIGYGAAVTASNTIQLGNTSVTNVKTSGALTTGTVTYPNAHNSTDGQVLTVNAAGTASWTTPASSSGTAHTVGEVYGGGIVFYITTGGFHGLIAETINSSGMSPADLLDLASDPIQHNTNNGGKLYTDWRVPTFTELKLLYAARNTVGLNLGTLTYQSSTLYYNFVYKALNFNTNTQDNVNGDWNPRITRYIRSF